MIVRIGQHLARLFRRGIRRERLVGRVGLDERNLVRIAIDRRSRGEDELAGRKLARHFEQVERAARVHVFVQQGFFIE